MDLSKSAPAFTEEVAKATVAVVAAPIAAAPTLAAAFKPFPMAPPNDDALLLASPNPFSYSLESRPNFANNSKTTLLIIASISLSNQQ